MISSYTLVFSTPGTNPAPMPWILCGPATTPKTLLSIQCKFVPVLAAAVRN